MRAQEINVHYLMCKERVKADIRGDQYQLPKAACRRVAVTPPAPASRRSGGGGATAYMPRKLACGTVKNSQNAPFFRFVSARTVNTLRKIFHDKSFSSAQENLETPQPRWDEIAERRPLDLVAAPTFPTLKKNSKTSENNFEKKNKILTTSKLKTILLKLSRTENVNLYLLIYVPLTLSESQVRTNLLCCLSAS